MRDLIAISASATAYPSISTPKPAVLLRLPAHSIAATFCTRKSRRYICIPDPPQLTKSAQTMGDIVALARQLGASGLLKADWAPLKHPRWPAGTPGSIGGEFAPRGDVADDFRTEEHGAPLIPAQLTLPAPFDWVVPRGAPLPGRPRSRLRRFAPPNVNPITIPLETLSWPAEMRKGVGRSNRILFGSVGGRSVGKRLHSWTGQNGSPMHYGPRFRRTAAAMR